MNTPVKASIQNDFKQELGCQSAPAFFNNETPLTPVAVIAGNIGISKPRSNQKLKYTTVRVGNASTQYQIATASSTKRVYFLGMFYCNNAAVAANLTVYDATTGATPTVNTNTSYADELGFIMNLISTATVNDKSGQFLPYPLEIKQGIRAQGGGAGQDNTYTIYFLEEEIGEK